MMEEWKKDLEKLLKTVVIAMETVADEVTETLEFVVENLEYEIFQAIEHLSLLIWSEGVGGSPLLEDEFASFEEDLGSPDEYGGTFKSEPTLRDYPACVDCCHYHGEVYGGNLFVCAMHPYGWDDENCPDWEQEAKKPGWDEPVDH